MNDGVKPETYLDTHSSKSLKMLVTSTLQCNEKEEKPFSAIK